MKAVKSGKPKVIYFDQCAIGDLMAPPPGSAWLEIMELLQRGLASGDIIFPMSLEHLLELSADSKRDAALLRRDALYAMARGVCFFHPERIAATSLLTMSSRRDLLLTEILGIIDHRDWTSDLDAINQVSKGAENAYRESNYLHNKITKPDPRVSKETKNAILCIHAAQSRESFDRLLRLLNAFEMFGVGDNEFTIRQRQLWPFEAAVFREYCALARSAEDMVSLRAVLSSYRDEDVPVIDVGSRLSLSFNLRQLGRETSDYFDFSRLKVAIPYADIVVTDRKQLAAIQEQGLDLKYQTKVFSCRPKNLGQLVEAIRLIV